MTTRRRRRRLVALLAAPALLLGTGPAVASDLGESAGAARIDYSEPTDRGLEILVSVPRGADVDTSGVRVTIDGEPADATAEPAGSSPRVRRTAVLAIDTSNSMRGPQFAAAQDAAVQFLESVPPDVSVGIVSFAGGVDTVLDPTTDRAAAIDVVNGLTLSRGTLLYDGLLAAVGMSGSSGQRNILVLSDGADTGSTPLEGVIDRVADSGVLVDVVALDQAGGALEALNRIAEAGGGRVIPARQEALAELFSAQADVLAEQIAVTAQVPAGLEGTEGTVSVTLPSSAGELVAESYTTIGTATAPRPALDLPAAPAAATGVPDWLVYAGAGLVGLGLFGVLLFLVPVRERPMSAAERVTTYAGADGRGGTHAAARPEEHALTQVREAAAEVLRHNKGLEARITHRLEGAGSPLKAAEWLLVHVGVVVASGLVGLLLGGGDLLVGLLFLAVGAIGPWVYLGMKRSRRRTAFATVLPDILQLMSGSLSAGLSLAQSVDTVVREGPEPIASEFKRVLIETRIGISLEDAFDGVAERFDSKDFAWVVMAIRIQRQVGGNLAELFDTVAATMREREYMRRQVAALAAEGKLSAWVLGALPPLFMLYLFLTNREYVGVMFTSPLGWTMIIGAGVWLAIGVFWMSRLVKVEV